MVNDMKSTREQHGEPAPLSFGKATRLMAQGLSERDAAAHDVVERVGRPGGAEWLQRVYADAGVGAAHEPPPLTELIARKERSKSAASSSSDAETRLQAHAVYLHSIASAIVHHGRLISSRPRDELDEVLVDFAAAAPPPWRELFMEAAMADARRAEE